jgi:competence protein ComEC
MVIVTHFHADHVGGLAEALAGRPVGELVHGLPCGQDQAASAAQSLASSAGAPVRQVTGREPVTGTAGPVKLAVYPSPLASICPRTAANGEDSAANNAGLAVLAQVDGVSVWALGDLEQAGQDELVAILRTQRGPHGEVPGEGGMVVVAHHGSANQSQALAQTLKGKLAVMSAGKDNAYGHPRAEAVKLYGEFGEVRRTDQDGIVAVSGEL